MDRPSKTKPFDHLVDEFCSVTGASKEIALHLLEACNGDLEMAVCMHIDGPGNAEASSVEDSQSSAYSDAPTAECLSSDVRAPIPQKREKLVDDQQHGFGLGSRRRAATSVFDGFRDFQAEIRQAEERAHQGGAISRRKKQTLEDLFRPPIDLMYKGSFHSAKEAGTASNKWLMVNIQNVQEFSCQVLNRDVWSNAAVKDIIKYHFIFWQVYSDSDDGKRYMQFYKVKKWPCIDVIDPVTGEHMVQWSDTDPATLIDLINAFIEEHPKPDGSTGSPPPPKKQKKAVRENSLIEASEESQLEAAIQASLKEVQSNAVVLSSDSEPTDCELETFSDSEVDIAQNQDSSGSSRASVMSLESESSCTSESSPSTELCQRKHRNKGKASMNARAVMKNGRFKTSSVILSSSDDSNPDDVQPKNNDSCHGNSIECVSQESQSSTKSWKDYLGQDSDSKTHLLIRFPDGKRDTLTLPCTSHLRAITEYISENNIDLETYEIVTNFPRRNFSSMDLDQTLQDIGLHAQETIFIHKKS